MVTGAYEYPFGFSTLQGFYFNNFCTPLREYGMIRDPGCLFLLIKGLEELSLCEYDFKCSYSPVLGVDCVST